MVASPRDQHTQQPLRLARRRPIHLAEISNTLPAARWATQAETGATGHKTRNPWSNLFVVRRVHGQRSWRPTLGSLVAHHVCRVRAAGWDGHGRPSNAARQTAGARIIHGGSCGKFRSIGGASSVDRDSGLGPDEPGDPVAARRTRRTRSARRTTRLLPALGEGVHHRALAPARSGTHVCGRTSRCSAADDRPDGAGRTRSGRARSPPPAQRTQSSSSVIRGDR